MILSKKPKLISGVVTTTPTIKLTPSRRTPPQSHDWLIRNVNNTKTMRLVIAAGPTQSANPTCKAENKLGGVKLHLNQFGKKNILCFPDFLEGGFRHIPVHVHHTDRQATFLLAAQRNAGNIDLRFG